jgi:geranylgeranyl reductase family protein
MGGKYDFIVVGAGSGGAVAAATAAKLGYKVLLIDRKPKEMIGDKACGEAVGRHHFDNLGIAPPKGEELSNIITGVEVVSPDLQTVLRIKQEGLHGYILNRLAFGQRLLREAIDSGCELLDQRVVTRPIIEHGRFVGVRYKCVGKAESAEAHSDILIDSSGVEAITRSWIPDEWGVERDILKEDLALCYVEIRKTDGVHDPEYIKICLSNTIAPGGYYWLFPKGEGLVNVGIGVQMVGNYPNPRLQFEKYVLNQGLLKNSKKVQGRGGIVPTRRPLNCLVGNGLILVGDSACMPNPVHGGGIGPSMIGGKLAAEVGSEAIERNDLTREALWSYNLKYMNSYGAKAAGLDVFRIFLQKCSDEDLSYGLATRLVMEDDILKASMGEALRLNITEKARRMFRGIRRLSFLKALNETAHKMGKIKRLYQEYPSPENLFSWVKNVDAIISDMKNMKL